MGASPHLARNVQALDSFIAYLEARPPWIPNNRQRCIERQYIGSGHVEKANDLIVIRRQKRHGIASGILVRVRALARIIAGHELHHTRALRIQYV